MTTNPASNQTKHTNPKKEVLHQEKVKIVQVSTLSCRCCCWSCCRGRHKSSCCCVIIIPTCSCCSCSISGLCSTIPCLRLSVSIGLLTVALLITLLLSRWSITISIVTLLCIALLGVTLLLSISSSLVTISCNL